MYSPGKVVYTTFALPLFILAMEASFHGRVFPPPRSVSQDADFQASMTSMASALEELMETTEEPGDNSIAIMGRSASEATTAFEFYHMGTQVDGATPKVGPDSIFRIGSVSKLFTVYTLLVQLGYDVFSAPVPKYVPELRHSRDVDFQHIDWDEISVSALASHMAGVPRDCKYCEATGYTLLIDIQTTTPILLPKLSRLNSWVYLSSPRAICPPVTETSPSPCVHAEVRATLEAGNFYTNNEL